MICSLVGQSLDWALCFEICIFEKSMLPPLPWEWCRRVWKWKREDKSKEWKDTKCSHGWYKVWIDWWSFNGDCSLSVCSYVIVFDKNNAKNVLCGLGFVIWGCAKRVVFLFQRLLACEKVQFGGSTWEAGCCKDVESKLNEKLGSLFGKSTRLFVVINRFWNLGIEVSFVPEFFWKYRNDIIFCSIWILEFWNKWLKFKCNYPTDLFILYEILR